MEGDLDKVLDALVEADTAAKLKGASGLGAPVAAD
jgi:hypothetical protein